MAACRIPQDVPQLVQIDLAFHRVLVESSRSSRLIELWSSLNGQIGALFIRGVERQHADVAAVVALHRELLEAVRSSDPQIIPQAILSHYVRSTPVDGRFGAVIQQTIQMIAPGLAAVRSEPDTEA
jgi:DNA-binding FadR family transcriptional regulator